MSALVARVGADPADERGVRMAPDPAVTAPVEDKRISIRLSAKSGEELENLCRLETKGITDLVRFGLALARLYFEENRKGNILVVATPNHRAIKEIVFPDF